MPQIPQDVINSLPWSTVSFGDKTFSSEGDDQCFISWQSGTCFFTIRSRDLGVLEFRVDREFLWVEYLAVEAIQSERPVTLSFLYMYNREVEWLPRLNISCGQDSHHDCMIVIKIDDKHLYYTNTSYQHLLTWMTPNFASRDMHALSVEDSSENWQSRRLKYTTFTDLTETQPEGSYEHEIIVIPDSDDDDEKTIVGSEIDDSPEPIKMSKTTHLGIQAIKRLRPGVYFNDELIDVCMNAYFAQASKRDPYVSTQINIMSCFFFSRIKQKHWPPIFRWIKPDMHSKKFWIIPIHDKARFHWSLMIMAMPSTLFIEQPAKEEPLFVLALDSYYKTGHEDHCKLLCRFMRSYVHHLLGKERTFPVVRMIRVQVPRQRNEVDCGPYVLHFANLFISHPEVYYAYVRVRFQFHGSIPLIADQQFKSIDHQNYHQVWRGEDAVKARQRISQMVLDEKLANSESLKVLETDIRLYDPGDEVVIAQRISSPISVS